MLTNLTVMIYVNDPEMVADFLEEAFNVDRNLEQELPNGSKTIRLPLSTTASVQLFSKEFVKKYSPEVSLEMPSLMLETDDLDGLREHIYSLGGPVGDIVDMGDARTFNFGDPEGNWFAVKGR